MTACRATRQPQETGPGAKRTVDEVLAVLVASVVERRWLTEKLGRDRVRGKVERRYKDLAERLSGVGGSSAPKLGARLKPGRLTIPVPKIGGV